MSDLPKSEISATFFLKRGGSFLRSAKLIPCSSLDEALEDGSPVRIECSDGYSLELEGGLPLDKARTVGIVCPDGKHLERVRLFAREGCFREFVRNFASGGVALFNEVEAPVPVSRQTSQTDDLSSFTPRGLLGTSAAVLGADSEASWAEIQRAYRRLASEYHPDRVAHLGPKLREVAHAEFQRINEAYEHLKKAHHARSGASPSETA